MPFRRRCHQIGARGCRPTFPTPSDALYVSATTGADSNPGTEASPFKTIAAAVAAAKSGATLVLREGTYHTDTVQIDAEKNGLTVQNCKSPLSRFCPGVTGTAFRSGQKHTNVNDPM